ncbi:hypothetical protein KC973_02600 [Candidatus Saccharibacteria bacterium]|nr:hypothetical protein [Candidatus Saccharibacteria bacterium]
MQLTKDYISSKFDEITTYLRTKRPELVAEAGSVDTSNKDDTYQTVLTRFDTEIEQKIRDILIDEKSLGICGEEHGTTGDEHNFWTIDPIDGTEHFVRGDPFYMCMVGLVLDDEPVAGLLYNYTLDQLYLALPGEAATCNGKVIHVSDRPLERAAIQIETKDKHIHHMFNESVLPAAYFLEAFGACSGFCLTQVARGASEARIHMTGYGHLWDYIPGFVLVRAAGGVVRNIGSDSWDWRNFDVIASNEVVADNLQALVLSPEA